MDNLKELLTLVQENEALNSRDRIVVPILTTLSYVFGGLEPEQVVAGILMTLGTLLMGCTALCNRGGTGIKVMNVLVISSSVAGLAMLHFGGVPPVPSQFDEDAYGATRFHDAPNLPPIKGKLIADGEYFKDENGRVLLLRGVNLGGDSKVPTTPNGATWNAENFYDYKHVSFVGRPFPVVQADEHLARLKAWGFTFVRFLITWEAIEHEGPGIYDKKYLEYLQRIIKKCHQHGISVFIDPHQDVWSRWTGGDGAPAWTLTKVGFKLEDLYETGATVHHQGHGDPFPQMVWPTNYNRLAAATMFTLFFAGNSFAPNTKVDGIPVQDYLQSHYINAIKQVATYLKDEPNVLGYDTLNEPSTGYTGLADLNNALFPAPMGWFMSGFEGMVLGAGQTLKVPFFSSPLIFDRFDEFNPTKKLAWQSQKHDIWQNEGVWKFENGKPKLLKPHHFATHPDGKPINFMKDFMAPFFEKFKNGIHSVHPDALIFAEPYIDPNSPVHDKAPENVSGDKYAWAPHYYDALALILKKARPWVALDIEIEAPVFGPQAADGAIAKNLEHVKTMGLSLGGKPKGGPVLIGEIGISMDHDRDEQGIAKAYKDGDFSSQIHSLDRTMRALEKNLLSFTLWNYSPKNTNKRGDLWNDEDLSLFSHDQQKIGFTEDLHSGGRALQAAVRPYPMKVCGTPKFLSFSPFEPERPFVFEFVTTEQDSCKDAPTIIFVPDYQYPLGVDVEVSGGKYKMKDQYLRYTHNGAGTHRIEMTGVGL